MTRFFRIFVWFALALTCMPILYLGVLAAAEPLFEIRTPIGPADAIIVLGGDGPSRAAKAAAVYRSIAEAEPRVLITGDVDCGYIAAAMRERGVPAQSIILECASRNTWENAQLSAPLLAGMRVRNAILVTSWFHMRRALGCFRSFSPQIAWRLAPVDRRLSFLDLAWNVEGVEVAKEYLKVTWYVVRHGINLSSARQML